MLISRKAEADVFYFLLSLPVSLQVWQYLHVGNALDRFFLPLNEFWPWLFIIKSRNFYNMSQGRDWIRYMHFRKWKRNRFPSLFSFQGAWGQWGEWTFIFNLLYIESVLILRYELNLTLKTTPRGNTVITIFLMRKVACNRRNSRS